MVNDHIRITKYIRYCDEEIRSLMKVFRWLTRIAPCEVKKTHTHAEPHTGNQPRNSKKELYDAQKSVTGFKSECKTDAARFFWNTKKCYLPSLPAFFISVSVMTEICSSIRPSFLPSSQGSPIAIEDNHEMSSLEINNGVQSCLIPHLFRRYFGWRMQC